MFKNILLAILLVGTSFSSMANWVGGVSYINLSEEDNTGLEVSLGGVTGSLAYKVESSDKFYFMPELRLGVGLTEDTLYFSGINLDIEIDSFIALSVRGQYELDDKFYVFAAPSYTNVGLKVTASYGGQSASVTEDSWEFGMGGGAGYNINESTSVEFMYEQYDGTDLLSFGIKFDL